MSEPVHDAPTGDRAEVERVMRERFPWLDEEDVAAAMARVDRAARRDARHRTQARDGRVVHHLDGNPYNNDPDNLVLVDPRER